MLAYSASWQLCFLKRQTMRIFFPCGVPRPLLHCRDCSGSGSAVDDSISTLMQLCSDRYYIPRQQLDNDYLHHGISCGYGPLGMELRKNILDRWWTAVVMSRPQVFGVSTLHGFRSSAATRTRTLKLVDSEALGHILSQRESNAEKTEYALKKLLSDSVSIRTNLMQGALEQYLTSLELVSRKLPFGLAETGMCYQLPEEGRSGEPGCPAEVMEASLVWFCSPRTSSQWLDYWSRQRLAWWRKFSLRPSNFSCSDIPEAGQEKEGERASQGVSVLYNFPWVAEPLETLQNLGDSVLLQAHKGNRSKLQCRDGRKPVVPHVLSVRGNMDRGVLAYLHDSLQHVKKVDSKQRLHKRKVLKLHPCLAPVKVALETGRGATVELRQVCERFHQELLDRGISSWPGYLETIPSSMEQLNTKYDEMGVLFTVVISDGSLENGLVQVRSRDTTIKETMHISEVRDFLTKYIAAADNT